MNYTFAYAMAIAGTAAVSLWVLLFILYRRQFDDIISAIDSKQFAMPEIFFIGFGFLKLFKINLKTTQGRKKEKKLAEIYGKKYAEFYRYVIIGGQITYAVTITPIGLFIGAMTNNATLAVLTLAAALALIAYLDLDINNSVNKKRKEILSDYPEVVSKLTLLINAGLVVRDAWTKIAYDSDKSLYKEMQAASEKMRNGTSEEDALFSFSQSCSVKEIRKFTSVLTQNLQKGGTELTTSLKFMTVESWDEKKHSAIRKGELANQKMLVPIIIMFVGILIMVVVPIFTNMFN